MLYRINARALEASLDSLHMDPRALPILTRKCIIEPFKITDVRTPAANIIKQEMLAAGGDCATPMSAVACTEKYVDIILLGTRKHYERLLGKLEQMPYFGLKKIARQLGAALREKEKLTRLADGRILHYEHCLVMGIINVTPDSFYTESRVGIERRDFATEQPLDLVAIANRAGKMLSEGAALLDVGGESTRPGAKQVTAEEEYARVVPAIKTIKERYPSAIVSVDTYRAATAQGALEAGADIINDITALEGDTAMEDLVVRSEAPVILMHAEGAPDAASCVQERATQYDDVVRRVAAYLDAQAQKLRERGVGADKIILDPGIGFGKSSVQNLNLLKNLETLTGGEYPVLLAASRKTVIGDVLGGLPPQGRLEGTLATTAQAVLSGCAMVRVHDVKEHVRLIRMMEAML